MGFAVLSAAYASQPAWWHVDEVDFVFMMHNDPTAWPGLSLLVTHAGQPAAVAVNFADTTLADAGLTGLFAVSPGFQGRGLGRALLLDSFARFKARSWDHARLATTYGFRPREPSVFNSVGMSPVFFNDIFLRSLD
jgi:GNAT superfamily N-acetyltransferase